MSANGRCRHCKRDDELVAVMVPAELSHQGRAYLKLATIDACIADIIRRLNAGATEPVTRGCCCGHGDGPGEIILQDGRSLTLPIAAGLEGNDG